jgi:hypothetical protein
MWKFWCMGKKKKKGDGAMAMAMVMIASQRCMIQLQLHAGSDLGPLIFRFCCTQYNIHSGRQQRGQPAAAEIS